MTNNGEQAPEAVNQSHEGKMERSDLTVTKEGIHTKRSSGRSVAILLVAVVVVGLLAITGIVPLLRSRKALAA